MKITRTPGTHLRQGALRLIFIFFFYFFFFFFFFFFHLHCPRSTKLFAAKRPRPGGASGAAVTFRARRGAPPGTPIPLVGKNDFSSPLRPRRARTKAGR